METRNKGYDFLLYKRVFSLIKGLLYFFSRLLSRLAMKKLSLYRGLKFRLSRVKMIS